ncbi:MAG: hypothetical protein ACI9FR_002957 [Cryomorphaceae bacterium]|jgi:hypothetical protein
MSPIEARNDGNRWLLTSSRCPFWGISTKSGGISVILIRASSYAEVSNTKVLKLIDNTETKWSVKLHLAASRVSLPDRTSLGSNSKPAKSSSAKWG